MTSAAGHRHDAAGDPTTVLDMGPPTMVLPVVEAESPTTALGGPGSAGGQTTERDQGEAERPSWVDTEESPSVDVGEGSKNTYPLEDAALGGAAAAVGGFDETDDRADPELEAPAGLPPAPAAAALAARAVEPEKDVASEPEADLTGEQEPQLFPEPGPELAALTEPELFTEPEPEPEHAPAPEPESPPGPHGSLDLRVAGARAAFNPPTPLPIGRGPDRSIPGAPVVAGSLCARGHLNRPGTHDCIRCSAPVSAAGSSTVSGTRPALGVLILDDGSVYRLERGYLVGSRPEGDPTVRGGLARPLTLSGEDVSATHAEVRLHDWDVLVTDRGSATGTCVFEPGGADWEPLRPYQPRTLVPGTHIAFGQRIATFVTPWIIPGDDAGQDT